MDLPELNEFLQEIESELEPTDCPDIVAAFVEAINVSRALLGSDIEVSSSALVDHWRNRPQSALLKMQMVLNDIFDASEATDPFVQLRALLIRNESSVDTLCVALQMIPKIWSAEETPTDQLLGLINVYVGLCTIVTDSARPRAVALDNLTDLLDKALPDRTYDRALSPLLVSLWNVLATGSMNPALANSIIRLSGSIMRGLPEHQEATAAGIRSWGLMMADAGQDDKVSPSSQSGAIHRLSL